MSKPSDKRRTASKGKRRHEPERSQRRWPTLPVWAAALLVGVVAVVAYLGIRAGDFVWDDQILLVEWPYYRDPALFSQALTRNLPFSPNYFRPVVALTFFANHALHGLVASGYRLANVLFHALTSILAYLLLRRWLSVGGVREDADAQPTAREPLREWLSLGLALLFAWHPVHVEAVALTVGRFDLLSTLFVLLALVLASLRAKKGQTQVLLAVGTGLAFLLALGSKEMAVTLPFLLLTFDALQGVRWRRRWPVYLAVVAAGAIYLTLRAAGLGYLYQPEPGAALPVGDPLQHLLLVGRSIARYLLLLVWPFGTLSPIHFGTLPVPRTDPLAWGELGVVLALLALLIWTLLRRKRAAWLWLAFAISLLPVVNILPLELRGGAIVAERFLYLPSFLFVLALGTTVLPLIRRLGSWATTADRRWLLPAIGVVGLAFLAACLVTTLSVVPHWRDDQSLWEWASARAPDSSLPYTNLSRVALDNGNWMLALEYADQARALNPDDATAYNNAGSALLNTGQVAEAETAFRQALALQPENTLYWTNLAAALASQGRLEEATEAIEQEVLSRDPSFGPAHALLGALYLNRGQPEEAVAALEQAQRYLPDPDIVRNDLSEALLAAGQIDKALRVLEEGEPLPAKRWVELGNQLATTSQPEAALKAYKQALQVNASVGGLDRSELVLLHVQRAAVYQALGDLDKAEEAAFLAMMTDQSEPLVHKAMGDLLRARGSLAAAQKAYERAQKMAPSIPDIYFDLGEVLWDQGKQEEARQKFDLYLQMVPNGQHVEDARGYLNP